MRADRETYTHGHDDSVLRSTPCAPSTTRPRTRGRPAVAGTVVLDVGCGPGTITVDLADGSLPAGCSGSSRSPSALEQPAPRAAAAQRRVRGRRRLRARPPRRHLRRRARPPGAAAPRGPGRGAAGDAAGLRARRSRRGARRRLRGHGVVPRRPGLDGWLEVYRAVAHGNGAEPDAGRRLLSWAEPPVPPRSSRPRRCGATRPRTTGSGGAACGPTASSTRRSPGRPSTAATPIRAELRGHLASLA